MKPRDNYEKRVAELNATLSETISVSDANWYKKVSRDWIFGHSHYCYFTTCTNMQEFKVKRLYRGYKFTDKNTDHFFFVEIMREFNDGFKSLYFAKHRTMGRYYDCFLYNSKMELRGVHNNYAGYNITDLFGLSCASRSQTKGEQITCSSVNPKEIARVVCNNPVAENLYKTNDSLFYHLLCRTYLKETCRAITLAKRHGFKFTDDNTHLWLDMVYAIIKCGKDYHNPVFIAPKDLRATHDRFIRMMIRKQQEEEIIRKNQEAEKKAKRELEYQNMYDKQRSRFFGMVLEKGSLSISVLQSIEDFKRESEHFHNCVYSNEYWNMKKHPNSLIMVAYIAGNKAELIEVDLNTYQVRQSFGKYNQYTNYHDRIVRFLRRNMTTIRNYNENINTNLKIAV